MNAVTEVMDELRKALAELEDCRARNADMRTMLEQVTRERDEARAEVEHAYREGGALYEAKIAGREAFRCGAEAMREACAEWISKHNGVSKWVYDDMLSDLPIPEEP